MLVSTQKTQKGLAGSEKEFERLHRIIVAAAEQSKNFCFPTLHPPVPLERSLNLLQEGDTFIHFDPTGLPMFAVAQQLKNAPQTRTFLMIGPEGDLTSEEQVLIKKHNAIFCALTPTVLRSVQALAIGAGLIRSIL